MVVYICQCTGKLELHMFVSGDTTSKELRKIQISLVPFVWFVCKQTYCRRDGLQPSPFVCGGLPSGRLLTRGQLLTQSQWYNPCEYFNVYGTPTTITKSLWKVQVAKLLLRVNKLLAYWLCPCPHLILKTLYTSATNHGVLPLLRPGGRKWSLLTGGWVGGLLCRDSCSNNCV